MFNERFKVGIATFGLTHIIVLLIFACIIGLVVKSRSFFASNPKADKIFRWSMAWFMLALDIGYSLWSMLYIKNKWTDIIPFEFCSIAMWLTFFAVLTRNQKLLRVSFFWGLTGPLLALIILQVQYRMPHFRFLHYFLWHFSIMLLNIYMYATGQVKLRIRDVSWAFLWLACAAFVNFFANRLLGTNFMFMAMLPPPIGKAVAVLGKYGYLPLFGLVIYCTFQLWYWLTVFSGFVSQKLFAKRTAEAYL